MKGRHEGEWEGIMPTYRNVEFPVIVSYEIVNNKIVTHCLVADPTILME